MAENKVVFQILISLLLLCVSFKKNKQRNHFLLQVVIQQMFYTGEGSLVSGKNRKQLAWPFTILQSDNIMISWDFLRQTAPAAMTGHLGAVSLKKSHDIVILSFCNIVKGQAISMKYVIAI